MPVEIKVKPTTYGGEKAELAVITNPKSAINSQDENEKIRNENKENEN